MFEPANPTPWVSNKLYKTKVKERPQIRSDQVPDLTLTSARGASAAMVPWPFRLKFGREMGTYPGRSMPMLGLGQATLKIWSQCIHSLMGKFQ